jgi:hypothetical protein
VTSGAADVMPPRHAVSIRVRRATRASLPRIQQVSRTPRAARTATVYEAVHGTVINRAKVLVGRVGLEPTTGGL